MKTLINLFVSLLIFGCNHPESAEYNRDANRSRVDKFLRIDSVVKDENRIATTDSSTSYRVIGVKDGDTIELLTEYSTTQTVRFGHIDCPEKNQPFGKNAKQFVSDKCFGMYVSLIHSNEFDRNHRLIAQVILGDGTNLNKLLVENGLAWHYKKYSDDGSYEMLENAARANQVGLWSDPNAIEPEKWRKGYRNTISGMVQ